MGSTQVLRALLRGEDCHCSGIGGSQPSLGNRGGDAFFLPVLPAGPKGCAKRKSKNILEKKAGWWQKLVDSREAGGNGVDLEPLINNVKLTTLVSQEGQSSINEVFLPFGLLYLRVAPKITTNPRYNGLVQVPVLLCELVQVCCERVGLEQAFVSHILTGLHLAGVHAGASCGVVRRVQRHQVQRMSAEESAGGVRGGPIAKPAIQASDTP